MIGELRLLNVNRVFERSTTAVTATSRGGMIGLAQAEALVAANGIWRGDCQLDEAVRPPQSPAESLSSPALVYAWLW